MEDEVRGKLVELVAQYGKSLLTNPQRVKALLRDYCGEHLREINAIHLAHQQRVPQRLRIRADSVPIGSLIASLTDQICDVVPLAEDAASWAVISWALALGLEVDDTVVDEGVDKAGMARPYPSKPRGTHMRRIGSVVQQATIGDIPEWDSLLRQYAISPDGDRIALRLNDNWDTWDEERHNVYVYDLNGELMTSFWDCHGGEQGVAFWPDSNHLLTPGCDPTGGDRDGLKCWQLGDYTHFSRPFADTPFGDINVDLMGASPSGRYVLGAPRRGRPSGRPVCVDSHQENRWWVMEGQHTHLGRYRFSSSERYVIPWSYHNSVVGMIDLQENRHAWPQEDGWGYSGRFVCFLGQNDRFLVATESYKQKGIMTLEMRDPQTLEKRVVGERDFLRIDNACLSPDGRVLAVADYYGNIHLWSADDYSDMLHIPTGLKRIARLCFSNDSNHLVAVEASLQPRCRAVVWRLE